VRIKVKGPFMGLVAHHQEGNQSLRKLAREEENLQQQQEEL
jgi:hypothetical protein